MRDSRLKSDLDPESEKFYENESRRDSRLKSDLDPESEKFYENESRNFFIH